jgi:hypothetical protein
MEESRMPIVTDKYRGTAFYRYVYGELLLAARYRGTITYQEIAAIMGLPMTGNHMSNQVGHILGEISEDEHLAGRPLLSAIAVNVRGEATGGFYALARDLGLVESAEPDKKFWERQRQEIYELWRRPLPGK